MELAELGDMESYLRNPKKGYGNLKVYHLVSTAEQIAQALTYLVCTFPQFMISIPTFTRPILIGLKTLKFAARRTSK